MPCDLRQEIILCNLPTLSTRTGSRFFAFSERSEAGRAQAGELVRIVILARILCRILIFCICFGSRRGRGTGARARRDG